MAVVAWFSGLDPKIQTALIAAFATLTGVVLKDVVVSLWKEQRRERKDALSIYRNYADPIASAASSLFWRLRETLIEEGRGAFLKSSGKATQFDQYKYESTLYRFGVLIGWLRAYRRELTFFSLNSPEKLGALRNAIQKFETALSDGAHVETQRVRSLAALWRLPLTDDKSKVSAIGVAVEQILKPALKSYNEITASALDSSERLALCKKVALEMTSRLSINPLPNKVIEETVSQAIHSLSIREAWLYRDFQSAIGDLMIKEVSGGSRRFELVGFAEFEELFLSERPDIRRWMERLNRLVDGLDISGADRFDARVQMLEETFLATIGLLKSLNSIDPKRGIVSDALLAQAKDLANDPSWRKSAAVN